MARSRHGPGASKKSLFICISVIRTPGLCSRSRPTMAPSGRTVKLAQRDGRAVLLFALTQKWFSAARHDIVAGTMVRQMLYFWSTTGDVRAL